MSLCAIPAIPTMAIVTPVPVIGVPLTPGEYAFATS